MNSRSIYNIEVVQSYYLIQASSGLCVTRVRQCQIESAPQRQRRATSEATAYEVCNTFLDEAKKTVKQLVGDAISALLPHAREACVTDVLATSSAVVSSIKALHGISIIYR